MNPKEVTKQTKRQIAKAREEIAEGKFLTLSQLKKKYTKSVEK